MLEDLKLKEIVKISDVFEAEVNLRLDFLDEELSRNKVQGYVPTNASVAALEAITKGIAGGTDRVHLITGARGTGKSHFGLVVGKFFSLPPDNPEVQSFLQKVTQRDSRPADFLRRTCHPEFKNVIEQACRDSQLLEVVVSHYNISDGMISKHS